MSFCLLCGRVVVPDPFSVCLACLVRPRVVVPAPIPATPGKRPLTADDLDRPGKEAVLLGVEAPARLKAEEAPDRVAVFASAPSPVRLTAEQVADNSLPPDFLEREVERMDEPALRSQPAEPDPVADLLPERELDLRRKANHLAFVVRDLLASCGDRRRPSDRALASVGCALAAYELAADECSVLRAMAEGDGVGDEDDLFPDGNIEEAAP